MLLVALASALAADEFEGLAFYAGDIHSHTGASGDGGSSDLGSCEQFSTGNAAECGSYLAIVDTAKDNGLDFLATVDHVTSAAATTSEENFLAVFRLVNAADDPAGGFVTLPGAEIFVELEDGKDVGHRSLFFFGDVATLAGLAMVDTQPSGSISNAVADCGVLTDFMDALTARFGDAVLIPHHPGVKKPMATDWNCFDSRYEPVVEVYSEHGSSMDDASSFDVPWSGYAAASTVTAALDPAGYGRRIGFAAGSDNHDTHPGQTCGLDTVQDQPYGSGLTMVFQPASASFDRAAVYDAFVARRTYATTGPKLPLVVEVQLADGTLVGTMGEEVPLVDGQDLVVEARVPGTAVPAILSMAAVGPGGAWPMAMTTDGTWRVTIPAAELPEHVFVDVELDAAVWWEDGCGDGGDSTIDHVWSSPTWFDPGGNDLDGDGYTLAEGDCDDGDERVNPGAPELCTKPEADQDCDGVPAADDPDCVHDTGDTGDTADTADTGDTAGDTADSGGDSAVWPEPDSGDALEPGPTHRCACGTDGAPAALGFVGALVALAARRRR